MGELFGRVRPATPLKWTGERFTTDTTGQVEVEHLHRYLLARHLTRGFDVLDIASGEGYGAAFLAQTARSVTGVEIDRTAVEHARSAYGAENLRFLEGNAQSIPIDDQSVDWVVSFETIEHFYGQTRFMAEIRRVLRPGGKLIISSPNRDVYSPQGGNSNQHHILELTRNEFEELLKSYFENVAILGQRPIVGSAIVRESDSDYPLNIVTFDHLSEDRFEDSNGFDRPLYYVAIASDSPIDSLSESFYFEPQSLLEEAMVILPALKTECRQMESLIEEQSRIIKSLSDDLGSTRAELGKTLAEAGTLRDQVKEEQGRTGRLAVEVVSLKTELANVPKAVMKFLKGYRARMRKILPQRKINSTETAFPSFFNAEWYLKRYPDVAESGMDPMVHYLASGRWEGRDGYPPPINFDRDFYLNHYPDVAGSGMDPLIHYVVYGYDEGRICCPPGPDSEQPCDVEDHGTDRD